MLSVIILAAGISSRMGDENKLLLPFQGKTVLRHTLESICAAGFDELILVTGYEQEKIRSQARGLNLIIVHNPEFISGMTGSIQRGVAVATGSGYMICLADMVNLRPGDYRLLRDNFELQWQSDKACITIPVVKNQRGNPVIFSSLHRQAILDNRDPEGCRSVLRANPQCCHFVEMESAILFEDMDTPEDFSRLSNGEV